MTDDQPFFTDEEYASRLARARAEMEARDLDGCLVSIPENIFWLTGLDHQGFFAYHILIVPRAEEEMVLIARNMEQVTIRNQVRRARFIGYADSDDHADITVQALRECGLARGRLGMDKDSMYLPYGVGERIVASLPEVEWENMSVLVDGLRATKSPRELACVREASRVSDAMMRAAIDSAGAGVNEREIAAEVHRAMILAGGENPGFGPFIRPTLRLGEEHTTWGNRYLANGDVLFLEMSGCVRRYHAPMGRLLFIGEPPPGTAEVQSVCLDAFTAVVKAIRPGVTAAAVYAAWQDVVDRAGLSEYRRHHCGYLVGIGFPPTWTGGNKVVGLRHDSDMELRAGMTFHLLSWLVGCSRGDYFVSDTAVCTEGGCEVLTSVSQSLHVV